MFLVLSVTLTGCVKTSQQTGDLSNGSTVDSVASPEEGEITSGLDDLSEIESLEQDLEDLGLDELEDLNFE